MHLIRVLLSYMKFKKVKKFLDYIMKYDIILFEKCGFGSKF